MSATLKILRQTAFASERYVKDAKSYSVHVVLKDKAFFVDVGLEDAEGKRALFDRGLLLDTQLIYDSPERLDGAGRPVDYIKVRPLECTAKTNATSDVITLECSIRILSSQNENALFRLRIRALSAATREPIQGLAVISDPIQVISKPSVLRKKQERERMKLDAARAGASATPSSSCASRGEKRPREDAADSSSSSAALLAALTALQQQQAQQAKLLQQLCDQQKVILAALANRPPAVCENCGSVSSSAWLPPLNFSATPVDASSSSSASDFEGALRNFVTAFDCLDQEQRAQKIRKVLSDFKSQTISPLLDLLWTESIHKQIEADANISAFDWTDTSQLCLKKNMELPANLDALLAAGEDVMSA
jgi:hypothetical protein